MIDNHNNAIEAREALPNSRLAFRALLCLVWARYTVYAYLLVIFKRMPIVNTFADAFFPLAVIALIVMAFPYIQKRIGMTELLIYSAVAIVVLGTMLFYESNIPYIQYYLSNIMLSAASMIFLGSCYDHEEDKIVLYWTSLVGIAIGVLFQYYRISAGKEMYYDNMDAAYKLLPSAMYLIYWAFLRRRIRYWIMAAFSAMSMFGYGTRGPILCVIVFVAVGYLYTSMRGKSWERISVRVLGTAVIIYFVFGNALELIAETLSNLFSRWGLSTRIFDYFLEGDIADSAGRDSLAKTIRSAIRSSPFLGYGLMGDRVILRGRYVHSVYLEIWCHFGVLIGSAVLFGICILAVKALSRQKNNPPVMYFMLMLISIVTIKLMLSGSYIVEPYFFFTLGALVAALRNGKKNRLN